METREGVIHCAWQVCLVQDVILIVTLKQMSTLQWKME